MKKSLYIIWSNEHNGWWRPARCGYTSHRSLAGEYTLEEATKIVQDANKYIKWEHMHDDEIPVPNEAIIPLE